MIYDTLNNLPNYLGMSDNLDAVIEFVMARDINNLPAGKTRIDGDKAVVTVSTVTPQTSDKALFQRRDQHCGNALRGPFCPLSGRGTVQIRPEGTGLRQAEKGRVQHRTGRRP